MTEGPFTTITVEEYNRLKATVEAAKRVLRMVPGKPGFTEAWLEWRKLAGKGESK